MNLVLLQNFFQPPSSVISSCVRAIDNVMCLHTLPQPCYVAQGCGLLIISRHELRVGTLYLCSLHCYLLLCVEVSNTTSTNFAIPLPRKHYCFRQIRNSNRPDHDLINKRIRPLSYGTLFRNYLVINNFSMYNTSSQGESGTLDRIRTTE